MPEQEVPATEFTRNFTQFREAVQRGPIAVTSHGRPTGYFVSPLDFQEFQRLRALAGRSRVVTDLSAEEMERITTSRMSPEHDHLNALLKE